VNLQLLSLFVAILSIPVVARAGEPDTTAVDLIMEEGMERSQVMDILSWMTDVHGPRLTGSPGYKEAAGWAVDKLTEMGLSNSHLEGWGPFGRGWQLERHTAHVITPQPFPLVSLPKAWSPGTDGKIEGDVILVDVPNDSVLQTFKGRLGGKFVMLDPERAVSPHFSGDAARRSEEELLRLANAQPPEDRQWRRRERTEEQQQKRLADYRRLLMAEEEGALALLDVSRGDRGNIFLQQAGVPSHPDTPRSARTRAWQEDAPDILPQVSLTAEHYNRIVRMLEKGQRVRMEMETEVRFFEVDSGYNIIAELPGSDLADQVVMIGAHFDSWHGATGATDNGAGSAICMEAMRILKATGLQPRRTIRIGLWGGEEQGLLGSEAYVKRHFGEQTGPDSNKVTKYKIEAERLSAYYNLDNGAGKIRGVYMQGNEAVRPYFREWLKPFESLGASTLSIANTGSTDHVAFDELGLPGFQFIQDGLEYFSTTHHSTMDFYDRVVEDDLKQAATILARFAYETAMMDERLPRKPMKNVMLEWAPEVFSK